MGIFIMSRRRESRSTGCSWDGVCGWVDRSLCMITVYMVYWDWERNGRMYVRIGRNCGPFTLYD